MSLALTGLSVEYPGAKSRLAATTAVDQLSLTLAAGEVLAILGPSGCGKSSVLRAIAGLVAPAAGQITWRGKDLDGVAPAQRNFGLMFQDGQLFNHYSVAQNVAFGLRTAAQRRQGALNRGERDQVVAQMLDLVGLAGFGERSIDTLSGGQAQRVALARALAPNPQLLLLDEPLSSLDRPLREELTVQIGEIIRGRGVSAIYVTHDLDEAFTIADTVAVMAEGRLLQIGPAMQVWAEPAHAQVAEFVGYQLFDDDAARLAIAPPDLLAFPQAARGSDDRVVGTGTVIGSGLWRSSQMLMVELADGRRVRAVPVVDTAAESERDAAAAAESAVSRSATAESAAAGSATEASSPEQALATAYPKGTKVELRARREIIL